MTPEQVFSQLNALCPNWLNVWKVIPVGIRGEWRIVFQVWLNTTAVNHKGVTFDSLQELFDEVAEVLPTINEGKMNIFGTDLFQYISGDMLLGKKVTKTIDHVTIEKIGQGKEEKQKPVLYFSDGKKGWILNKTSARAIANVLGSETNDWKGAKIVLTSEKMFAFGKELNVIRVASVTAVKGGKAKAIEIASDELLEDELPLEYDFADAQPNGAYEN